jgi:predicted RNA binding protein YcfA (HicA-like mRNA interferase family)
MSTKEKLRKKLLDGKSDKNFEFDELCTVVQHLGFISRARKGGHTVFHKEGISEIVNLQPTRDGKAKPYQVRQIRDIVLKHQL